VNYADIIPFEEKNKRKYEENLSRTFDRAPMDLKRLRSNDFESVPAGRTILGFVAPPEL
jgi:hypothetical protein